jgi:hypothetical protein
MNTADRLGLPVTVRQIDALAAAVEPHLAPDRVEREVPQVPASPRRAPEAKQRMRIAVVAEGPTPAQLDALVAKTRDRALTGPEVRALTDGIEVLRRAAVSHGGVLLRRDPLDVACPKCGSAPGESCHTMGRKASCGPHLDRVRAAA